jgi:hypothetical protein
MPGGNRQREKEFQNTGLKIWIHADARMWVCAIVGMWESVSVDPPLRGFFFPGGKEAPEKKVEFSAVVKQKERQGCGGPDNGSDRTKTALEDA